MSDPQKDDVSKKPFAVLFDRLSNIAGVFLFALGTCIAIDDHPIWAAVFLTWAIIWDNLFGSTGWLRGDRGPVS